MATSNIYAMADTWNNGATVFTAIQMNVTDTASAAGSLLMDLQVGGVSKLKVLKGGYLDVGNTAAGFSNTGILAEGMTLGTNSNTANVAGEQLNVYASGTNAGQWAFGSGLRFNSATYLGWTSGAGTAAADILLTRKAAGVVSVDTVSGNTLGQLYAGTLRTGQTTVAGLPSAVTSGAGSTAFVTDATAPTFGATVAGAGTVATPVYSDGTNWKVG